MKRFLCFLLSLIMLVVGCACGNTAETEITEDELEVLLDSYIELTRYVRVQCPSNDWEQSVEINGMIYYRVIDEKFDTWDKWEAYVLSIVCGSLADYFLSDDDFADVDGALYVTDGTGAWEYKSEYDYEITSNGDGKIIVELYLTPVWDEDPVETHTYSLVLTDVGWRLDRAGE